MIGREVDVKSGDREKEDGDGEIFHKRDTERKSSRGEALRRR